MVKTTVFLQDMGDFARMNGVYAGVLPGNPPRTQHGPVAGLPKGALVEIECVALLNAGRGD